MKNWIAACVGVTVALVVGGAIAMMKPPEPSGFVNWYCGTLENADTAMRAEQRYGFYKDRFVHEFDRLGDDCSLGGAVIKTHHLDHYVRIGHNTIPIYRVEISNDMGEGNSFVAYAGKPEYAE